MPIISLKHQLAILLSRFYDQNRQTHWFLKTERTIEPQALVLSLIATLSKGNCHAIADLHRQFNGMTLDEKQSVACKPFP